MLSKELLSKQHTAGRPFSPTLGSPRSTGVWRTVPGLGTPGEHWALGLPPAQSVLQSPAQTILPTRPSRTLHQSTSVRPLLDVLGFNPCPLSSLSLSLSLVCSNLFPRPVSSRRRGFLYDAHLPCSAWHIVGTQGTCMSSDGGISVSVRAQTFITRFPRWQGDLCTAS